MPLVTYGSCAYQESYSRSNVDFIYEADVDYVLQRVKTLTKDEWLTFLEHYKEQIEEREATVSFLARLWTAVRLTLANSHLMFGIG